MNLLAVLDRYEINLRVCCHEGCDRFLTYIDNGEQSYSEYCYSRDVPLEETAFMIQCMNCDCDMDRATACSKHADEIIKFTEDGIPLCYDCYDHYNQNKDREDFEFFSYNPRYSQFNS